MERQTNIATNKHEAESVETVRPLSLVKEHEPAGRLSQEHFDLFLPALRNAVEANQRLQQVQQAFAQAQAQQQASSGALLYVVNHLRPKYEMSPTDDIDQDGVIIRAPK